MGNMAGGLWWMKGVLRYGGTGLGVPGGGMECWEGVMLGFDDEFGGPLGCFGMEGEAGQFSGGVSG